MRFDCGETWAEKKARLGQWHRKFLWWPTKLADHDCRWLEYVERRGTYESWSEGSYWNWEYRSIDDNR
jgi:hypothetical protein